MFWFTNMFSRPTVTIINVPKIALFNGFGGDGFFAWMSEHLTVFWLLVGILFLFSEVSAPGLFFFLSFAIGSFAAALFSFIGLSFVLQCSFGLVVSIFSFVIMRTLLKKHHYSNVTYSDSRTNISALIGKRGVLITGIKDGSYGRVKVRGEEWSAQADNGTEISKGQNVKVVSIKGNKLVVKVYLTKEESA